MWSSRRLCVPPRHAAPSTCSMTNWWGWCRATTRSPSVTRSHRPTSTGRYVAFSTTPEAGFENERFLGPSRVAPKEILRVESTTAILGLVATSDRITILSHSVAVGHSGVRLLRLDPPPPVRWSMSVSDVELGSTVEMTIDRLAAWWSRPRSSQVTRSPVQPDVR